MVGIVVSVGMIGIGVFVGGGRGVNVGSSGDGSGSSTLKWTIFSADPFVPSMCKRRAIVLPDRFETFQLNKRSLLTGWFPCASVVQLDGLSLNPKSSRQDLKLPVALAVPLTVNMFCEMMSPSLMLKTNSGRGSFFVHSRCGA